MKTSTMAVGFIQILDLSHFHPSMNQVSMKAVVAIAATAHCAIAPSPASSICLVLKTGIPSRPMCLICSQKNHWGGGCRLDTCFTTNVLTTFNHYIVALFSPAGWSKLQKYQYSLLTVQLSPFWTLQTCYMDPKQWFLYHDSPVRNLSDVWGFICMSLKMRYYVLPPDICLLFVYHLKNMLVPKILPCFLKT